MNNIMIPVNEQDAKDLAFMDIACTLAEEALQAREVPVGCVLVCNGQIVARGRNRTNEGRNATLHAEFDALQHLLPDRTHAQTPGMSRPYTPQFDGDGDDDEDSDNDQDPAATSNMTSSVTSSNASSDALTFGDQAQPSAVATAALLLNRHNNKKRQKKPRKIWQTPLKDVTLYVTVEPCIMCASAMRQVGIGKVVYGCANDRFGGCGGVQSINADPRLLYAPPYLAVGGYRREQAIMFLRRFYIEENTNAPKPKKKAGRVLKTVIPDVPNSPRSNSPHGTPPIGGNKPALQGTP
ncbi:tRNA(adenine34) deaminase [Microbotryomycetes sp. JL221]|nr:tRNA(adenine34) deaminase [Microbotryomycetes sp. JL221]